MTLRSRLTLGLALGPLAVALVAGTSGAAAAVNEPVSYAAAVPPAVGALFTLTPTGTLGIHFCTATVVDSPRGDVVVTAAHCLSGYAARSFAFVPGYYHGAAPLGIWVVDKIFTDTAWASSASPDDDFAFLVVSQPGSQWSLEALTGAERLSTSGPPGRQVTVAGFPASTDTPIACQNTLIEFSPTQMEFDCGGYSDGTSGSALIVDPNAETGLGTVVGVIGGYQQGGDTPAISYAAAFGPNTNLLYQQALAAA